MYYRGFNPRFQPKSIGNHCQYVASCGANDLYYHEISQHRGQYCGAFGYRNRYWCDGRCGSCADGKHLKATRTHSKSPQRDIWKRIRNIDIRGC